MRLFKKTDLLIIFLLCVLSLFFLRYSKKEYDSLYVEIYHHNELVQRIPLERPQSRSVFSDHSQEHSQEHSPRNIVEIDGVKIEIAPDGAVSFVHSDCPDQICVHSGKIRRNGEQIACVPNHILIKIVGQKSERLSASFTGSFNTVSSIVSVGLSEPEFERVAAMFLTELQQLHLLYSIYDDAHHHSNSSEQSVQQQHSDHESKPLHLLMKHNLKYINEHERGEYPIHPDLASLLLYADEVREITKGKVDITIGRLLALWHHARETGALPPVHAIDEAMDKLKERSAIRNSGQENSDGQDSNEKHSNENDSDDMDSSEKESGICEANKIKESKTYEIKHSGGQDFLHIQQKGFAFDVGAIAKGFALDLLCEKLTQYLSEEHPNEDTSFLISLGGNIRAVGEKSDWVIGIQHPDRNAVYASFVLPAGMAVATSGDYERYMEVDGKRYHHIIDIETGYPADYEIRSVTVIAKSGALSDALTTALFVMPVEEGLDFAERQGAQVFYILDDLRIVTSKGFPKWQKRNP